LHFSVFSEVVCSPDMLNTPGRVDWKACKVEMEEEAADTKEFRNQFKAFDFTRKK
jgi:hypothetical protein